ncbi:MAG: FecR domain-containing protein [Hyphomicrobiaceae bacterium]
MEHDDPSSRNAAGANRANSENDPLIEAALDWFVRLQANPGDARIARGFRAWAESDPRHAAAFEKVTAMWGSPEFGLAADNVAQATGFSVSKTKASGSRSFTRKVAGVATAVLLIWGAANASDFMIWMRADYTTVTGERRTISLPDGSTMILNTGSAVALNFGGTRRTVTLLEGEAYFDVVPNAAKLFRVDGSYSSVEVKGTAFAVRLDGDADDVTLSRGVVDVSRAGSLASEHAQLRPEQAVSVTVSAIAPVRQVDPQAALAWLDGRISFTDRPFGEVLNQLRRYYRGRVVVVNSSLSSVAVSGNYRLDEPDIAIQSIAEAAGATVTKLPGGIIVVR